MRLRHMILAALCLFALVGCSDASATSVTSATSATSAPAATIASGAATSGATSAAVTTTPAATGSTNLTHVVVSMGFIPSVQFAPYYVAVDKGYYAAEGLAVELNHDQVQAQLQLLASDKFDFAVTSGDTLIQARALSLCQTRHARQPMTIRRLPPKRKPILPLLPACTSAT